jgi:hypothetical protein
MALYGTVILYVKKSIAKSGSLSLEDNKAEPDGLWLHVISKRSKPSNGYWIRTTALTGYSESTRSGVSKDPESVP